MAHEAEALHYDSEHLWPDESWGPWCLELHWDFIDSRWALTGLTMRSCTSPVKSGDALAQASLRYEATHPRSVAPPGTPQELTTRELRSLRLADIAQKEQGHLQRLLVEAGGIAPTPRPPGDTSQREGPGRPPLYTDEHFREVAHVYSDAYRNQSRNPTMKVAKVYHVSRSTAAKWVARARDLGFLGRTEQRVAGGIPAEEMHTVGLTEKDGPPYVRFSGAQSARHTAWISCPHGASLSRLTQLLAQSPAALQRVRESGAARILVEYFGHHLSPAEDALLERFSAHQTGPAFWRDVQKAGLRADDEEPARERR